MEKDQRKPQDPGQPIGQGGNPGQGNPGQGNPGQGNLQARVIRVRITRVKAVGPVRTTLDRAIPASVRVRTLPDKGSPARAAAG